MKSEQYFICYEFIQISIITLLTDLRYSKI